jgi:hypothetical protein
MRLTILRYTFSRHHSFDLEYAKPIALPIKRNVSAQGI